MVRILTEKITRFGKGKMYKGGAKFREKFREKGKIREINKAS